MAERWGQNDGIKNCTLFVFIRVHAHYPRLKFFFLLIFVSDVRPRWTTNMCFVRSAAAAAIGS
jgi:hypothetical protein